MFERENAQKGSRPISSRWPGASCKSAARPVLPHVPRVLDESAGSFRTREETPRVREAAGKDRGARLRLTDHPRALPFGFTSRRRSSRSRLVGIGFGCFAAARATALNRPNGLQPPFWRFANARSAIG